MTAKQRTDLILEAMHADVGAFVRQEHNIDSATEYEDRLGRAKFGATALQAGRSALGIGRGRGGTKLTLPLPKR